jgi:hypothetical protein
MIRNSPGIGELCPKACNVVCTQSLSAASSETSTDIPTEGFVDTCVAENLSWRCKIPGVSLHYLNTCGQCSAKKYKDSTVKFLIENKQLKIEHCDYFHYNATLERVERMCSKEKFMNTCR